MIQPGLVDSRVQPQPINLTDQQKGPKPPFAVKVQADTRQTLTSSSLLEPIGQAKKVNPQPQDQCVGCQNWMDDELRKLITENLVAPSKKKELKETHGVPIKFSLL